MSADPEGILTFDHGGVKYTAVFGFRAMKAVEAHYDKPFFHAIQTAMPQIQAEDAADAAKLRAAALGLKVTDVGVLFRFSLLQHHRDLTEDDVDDLIDGLGLSKVGQIIGQAISAAVIEEGDGSSAENPRKRRQKDKTG